MSEQHGFGLGENFLPVEDAPLQKTHFVTLYGDIADSVDVEQAVDERRPLVLLRRRRIEGQNHVVDQWIGHMEGARVGVRMEFPLETELLVPVGVALLKRTPDSAKPYSELTKLQAQWQISNEFLALTTKVGNEHTFSPVLVDGVAWHREMHWVANPRHHDRTFSRADIITGKVLFVNKKEGPLKKYTKEKSGAETRSFKASCCRTTYCRRRQILQGRHQA